MHHFAYRDGVLHAEDVDLRRIAEEVGTPFYCYSSATLERHYRVFAEAFSDRDALVCYADEGEFEPGGAEDAGRARRRHGHRLGRRIAPRACGGRSRPSESYSRASARPAREMAFALDSGILCFNVESEPELETLSEVAVAKGVPARISIRINPDVDAKTHKKISTGKSENKFGIPIARARDVYALAAKLPGIEVTGVDMHIGSQIIDLEPFDNATALLAELARDLMADGHKLHHIDLGGGLGIPYRADNEPPPDPQAYAAIIKRHTSDLGLKLVFEMGRLIAGNAGILVTQVIYVKQGADKSFVIVDAAMNDLIRPTLYDAFHDIKPVSEPGPDAPRLVADVVGPVCETGDYLALARDMPMVKPGDLLAVMTTGAYGAVTANTYNYPPLIPEVLVKNGRPCGHPPAASYDDLIGLDQMPAWLS